MMLEFASAIDELERWKEGRAVVLVGESGTFCSGADLASSQELFTAQYGEAMCTVMHDATGRLSALPLVSVAAIEGAAVGGGTELATCTDYRVSSMSAAWQMVQVQRGVVPGWGGLARLVQICGRKNALFLLGSGSRITASQAADFQLVDSIVATASDAPDGSGPSAPSASADWGGAGAASAPSDGEGGGGVYSRSIVDHAVDFLAPFLQPDNDLAAARALKTALGPWGRQSEEIAAEERSEFQRLWGSPGQLAILNRFRKAPRAQGTSP